jgi:hypothetical protein
MTYKKNLSAQRVCVVLFVLLSISILQTNQLTFAQNQNSTQNPWAMSLKAQEVGQNNINGIFSPFDQIQLIANVTYNNAAQPNILVTFQAGGPVNASNPINITRIETTNSSGIAAFPFRLPVESQNQSSLVGIWQVSATIPTTNGTLTQNLSFAVGWAMEIASITIINPLGQPVFAPSDSVTVQLAINNTGKPQTANITINMQDLVGNIINQTQIQNKQIETTSANSTQVQATLQIPENASAGQMAIKAAIYCGNYLGVDIPVTESQTAYFTVSINGTSTPTPSLTPTPTPTPSSTPTPTETPTPIENTVSLFSWLLVATGFFTFTILYMFLKRKPMPKIGIQMPNLPSPTPGQGAMSPTQPASPATLTPKIAPEKTINATVVTQLPSIFETLEIASPQSTPAQEQKQSIVNYLAKISSGSERVQALEAELRTEKEQLNKEITGLTQTLEEQERAVKNYFDSIRQEIAKLNANINHTEPTATQEKKPDQPPNAEKTENNNN